MMVMLLLLALPMDLPASTAKKLQSHRDVLEEERQAAGAVLLDSIDAHKKMVANLPGLPAAIRLEQAEAVERERRAFVQNRSLPLSAGLRNESLVYLTRVAVAEGRLIKALDQAATAATKEGDMSHPHVPCEQQIEMMLADLKRPWIDGKPLFDRIVGVKGDSTGQGDIPMEYLQAHSALPAAAKSHIKITLQSKNDRYLAFEQVLFRDADDPLRFSYPADHPLAGEFEEQTAKLLRECK